LASPPVVRKTTEEDGKLSVSSDGNCSFLRFSKEEFPMTTQSERGDAFRALHEGPSAFVIPNPWDIGTARILAGLGFKALATTSAGFAYSIGQRDTAPGRERILQHAAELTSATSLPVSADLEDGFGSDPDTVSETIRLAAAAGLVGGSIEDSTRQGESPVYELSLAVERVRAAVEARASLPFTFTLTARAENHVVGRNDLKDTIRRLQAFQEAGADVLYAPGLITRDDIAAVVSAVDRPVNVLAGLPRMHLTCQELSDIGVRRISLGGGLTRVALDAMISAAREIIENGTFGFGARGISSREIVSIMERDHAQPPSK
jgi:2-methylisocitrate lyase-like PEP mutase family enzyme